VTRRGLPFLVVALLILGRGLSAAQTNNGIRPGSLRLTVRDAMSLPIAGAEVHLTAPDGTPRAAVTDAGGVADFPAIPPGQYEAHISSPGFEPATLSALTVKSGARLSRNVDLKIAGFTEDVDVLPPDTDRQLADAFTTDLTPDEIAALPEDPDELAEVLAQLAGADADIRIDGFADGELPPGTEIQSIRIRYDAASAGSSGGGPRIEIRTQPGGDRWRSRASVRLRDEALDARNAFASTRPSGTTRQYSWSVNGPLVKHRTGLSLTLDQSQSLDQLAIRAATPDGIFSDLVRQPSKRLGVTARLEHMITPAQRLRVDVRQSNNHSINQGLGEFDLPERGYARDTSSGQIRVGHNATLRGEMVHDARLQVRWRSDDSQPESLATAIRVPGAFSSGGAQVQGGRQTTEFEFEDELMFPVHSRHQVTTGMNVIGGHYHGDEWRNAGGTFTFASLDALAAGQPDSFTQRVGNPAFAYSLYRFGAFIQDDFRLRQNLMLNIGVRHESQTHLSDWANFAPRLGVNWTPSARLKTTLRGSFGVSFQALQGSVYEQTLLVNGARQHDIVIAAPSYPDPFLGDVDADDSAPGITRADPDLVMPSTRRVSLGLDQPIRSARLRVSYTRQMGHNVFRSLDANAPVDGVRPDPAASTITELESAARSLTQALDVNLRLNYRPHHLSLNTTYTLGQARNETDGPLTLPPDSADLSGEWGPSGQDIRHRLTAMANAELWFGFKIDGRVRLQSAAPYTITTGLDTNGDGVSNERPFGVERNSERAAGLRNLDLTLTWGVGMGQRAPTQTTPPRGRIGALLGNAVPAPQPVVRVEIYAQANNVLNSVNLQNFSGVLTSPFFGMATSASAPRRLSIGARVFF
jgi:hypothetical protein